MTKTVRRVVTGLDEQGRSCVVSDAESVVTLGTESSPVILTELWKTKESPAEDVSVAKSGHDGEGWLDPVVGPVVIAPGPTGTIFRICEFPPQSKLAAGDWGATLRAMGQSPTESATSGYHATDTIDYTVVLEGEIWVKLEKEEVVLRAGDTIVQRGVSHAWENRGESSCRFAAVLIGARPRGLGS